MKKRRRTRADKRLKRRKKRRAKRATTAAAAAIPHLPEAAAPPASQAPSPPERTLVDLIEARALPLVSELVRVAESGEPPPVKLETALNVLFGVYASGDPDFSGLMLEGWLRAGQDKQYRLRLAWQREQLRLAIKDILAEGALHGAFRAGLDAGAVASVMLGTAEGCLLQAATEGGAVTPVELVQTLIGLALNAA